MTKAVIRGLCSRLQDMEYDGATYKARTLDVTLQKLGWVGLCMGFKLGGPAWHIIKIQYEVTRERLIQSVLMNAMGLSILAFQIRAYNQQGIPAEQGLADLDRDLPREGILTLAMVPILDPEAMEAVHTEEARLGEGLMFEYTPPDWAENPFGELDDGPFEPEDDSSIEEIPPNPPPRGNSLEEEAQDSEEEEGDRSPPQFVPFDQVANYNYINLAAADDQPDLFVKSEYVDLAAEEDEPRERRRRGAAWSSVKGPVFRPHPKPRPRPRPRPGQRP